MSAQRGGRRTPAAGKGSDREIAFVFEGRRLRARAGETVAAALLANGVRVFGRSSKYHRARGYRCGRGHCSCCAMRVDGLPGVRTCVTTVRPGMTVEREHAWPSADHDLLRVTEAFSPLLPPGFYYRWWRRSPRLFAVFERLLAHAAGQGRLPSPHAVGRLAAARCERREQVDVLVVGAGVAGMSAALAAGDAGAHVLLVEQDDRLGGRLADDTRLFAGLAAIAGGDEPTGPAIAAGMAAAVLAHERIEVLLDAEAVGWYEDDTIAVDRHSDLLVVNPAAVVLATGAYDLGLPFPNCDLPGVVLASGAQRLVNRYGVRPGSRAVFVTRDDFAYAVAMQFTAAGIDVVCVADRRRRDEIDERLIGELATRGVPAVTGVERVRADGLGRVSSFSLQVAGDQGRVNQRYDCDVVCVSAGLSPADELAYQALSEGALVLSAPGLAERDEAGRVGSGDRRGPWLAGLVAGADSPVIAIGQGKAAGLAAARSRR